MEFVLQGYCGLYCGACPIMLNTKAGAGTEQCYGCKSEQPAGSRPAHVEKAMNFVMSVMN